MRTKENIEPLKAAYIIVAVVAVIAIFPIDSFTFYMFVRWVVFLGCILTVPLFIVARNYAGWVLLSLLGAFDFNPFSINTGTKSWWIVADIVAAAYFFYLTKLTQIVIRDIELKKDPPETSEEEVKRLEKERLVRIAERDSKILSLREKDKVSTERLKSLAQNTFYYQDRDIFTSKEIRENRKNLNRIKPREAIVGSIAIFALGVVIYLFIRTLKYDREFINDHSNVLEPIFIILLLAIGIGLRLKAALSRKRKSK